MKEDNAMATSSFDSPESSVLNVSEHKTNGTRLSRLLIDAGTHALRKYFDTIHLPENLKDELNNNRPMLQALRNRRVISESQWEKLFPFSGDPQDSQTFDITLLHLLLREICHLTAPSTGWHNMPADDDTSPEASITKIKCFRNELCHSISTGVSNDVFEASWDNIASSLVALGLDQREVDHLKTDPIDHDTQRRVEEEVKRLDLDYKEEQRNVNQDLKELQGNISLVQDSVSKPCTPALFSNLPDEHPHVFGRSREIKQGTEAVQSGVVSVVLITGGPGFGKTTVANKVAHALAKPECGKTVLCCSLRSKATLSDVATEMVLVCNKNIIQSPENPVHWLLNWSKQDIRDIVFVLDDADDLLESDEQQHFINVLSKIRMFSNRNVTFAITSRKVFRYTSDPSLQIKEVNLGCLSVEEAKDILLSQVEQEETRRNLSKVEKMVELCGRVPLALCIVGSLLSDYTEDRLVTQLETEPLETLQNDQVSVEKAIKTSFDLLAEHEKEVLVLLSVFPGSFNSVAAETVIKECQQIEVQPVSILRSLKHRSLVEQPISCRYQIHQLIQSFVRKIGQQKYAHHLDRGENVACSHFISRISANSEMYWGKDTSKQSIKSFNEDRHNFEYFLQVYVHGMEEHDPAIVDRTNIFLDNFPQKCMYLEMCVLPRVYIDLLKRLLQSLNEQPVHKIELLCLLGHESRKVGDRQQYKRCMKEAGELYLNTGYLREEALSKVLFLNSLGRIFSEERETSIAKRLFYIALRVCCRGLGLDHPETAETLLLVGRQQKRLRNLTKAEPMLIAARDMFRKCLVKHFMTAQALKDLADFYFLPEEFKTEADRSRALYEEALKVMEELGIEDQKECIITLKNLALCYKSKEKFEEAASLLHRASNIAERELETDHKWKVYVTTSLALTLSKAGDLEGAQAMMRKGLQMWNRLKQPVDILPNRFEVREFLRFNPEAFPKNMLL